MPEMLNRTVSAVVLLLSTYSVLKFAFFFVLPYERRRALLDRSYDGKAYATGVSDKILLVVVIALSTMLLATRREPVSFLGGLFAGAVLIQLFFHAFHAPIPAEREASEPTSPLKRMSYAIQDRPQRAWKEMAIYAAIVIAGMTLCFGR